MMRNNVIWAIRDARGLTSDEKALLFVIESRGRSFVSAESNWNDVGMTKAKFYRIRKSLINKGLINAQRRMNEHTVYSVNEDALLSYVPVSPVELARLTSETTTSHQENYLVSPVKLPRLTSETSTSHQQETEEELKKNNKKNIKKNISDDFSDEEIKETPGDSDDTSLLLNSSSLLQNDNDFQPSSLLETGAAPAPYYPYRTIKQFIERTHKDWTPYMRQEVLTKAVHLSDEWEDELPSLVRRAKEIIDEEDAWW